MIETKVICCDCDGHFAIEETHKIKINGLVMDFYICDTCLGGVPKINEKILEPAVRKIYTVDS